MASVSWRVFAAPGKEPITGRKEAEPSPPARGGSPRGEQALDCAAMTLLIIAVLVAQVPWDVAKSVAGNATMKKLETEVNKRLLSEGRKNQCTFKTDSDQFDRNCDQKLRNLGNALIDAKKRLNSSGVKNFKFEVSGHTDSSGNEPHNKELSQKRAAVIVQELIKRGVPESEIVPVGRGSSERLVTPDDTPAKKAKNRRYEVRVRL
jgi:outer membrane protein OmpA-like peptidoglycan-associated protein